MTTAATLAPSHVDLYRAKRAPELVEVPPARFFMIDGAGDPNTTTRFADCIQALYSAAYTLKFTMKKAGLDAGRVPPLEGLFTGDFAAGEKGDWSWTLMIRLPDSAPDALVKESLAAAAAKKPDAPIGELRVKKFDEGLSAQVMHVGPYAAEMPTIAALHAFIAAEGRKPRGRHHEIYLGDPRRAAPEKLKTVIRQPVSRS